ncbi:aldo/keto reductase [Pseudobutyrivibrio sp.]|uniref:aldo/keto reductase n=1 Tax=Pseudobutyrivibrio sp. TaxID=2014367 RepID=UPI0025DE8228|nr:aldo/keto reductase [Pseudobutyrivibrio sp.]MBR5649846.1 aldo/keto reductase [Pseudobutyrivibrio sp.]
MLYRNDRYGNPISILGYGCMRFTTKGGSIDIDKAEKEIMAAYEAGVNYYDTAYVYPGSEATLGAILERNNIREKINIATKLPQYLVKNRESLDKYFDEELKRLKTDYIDYYLMHHMTAINQWDKLEQVGIREWIKEKKESGQIRNIGFSYHGNTEDFIGILDSYDWDFCQIQYNYVDEHTQAGLKGLRYAAEKGIPVVIMEPLRGGKLVNLLPEKAKKEIAASPKGYTNAELGLRWLWNQPEVTCVLSGMNSPEMVAENCRIASDAEAGSFDEDDFALIERVKEAIRETERVGCTGCRYCMPCPKGVDIPALFRSYNMTSLESKSQARFEYAQTVGLKSEPAFATQCIECGKCEQHCPQNIPIRQMIKEADRVVRPWPYKIGINIVRKFFLKK